MEEDGRPEREGPGDQERAGVFLKVDEASIGMWVPEEEVEQLTIFWRTCYDIYQRRGFVSKISCVICGSCYEVFVRSSILSREV